MHLTHPCLPDGPLFLLSSPEVTSDFGLMFAILRLLLQFAYILKKKKQFVGLLQNDTGQPQ